MGQQQLLLIVLGVIIVGIAVVVGINLFNANAEESAKDTLVSEGINLGALAQQHFKKPTALGGGGNTFAGFTVAKVSDKLTSSPSASWDWAENTTDTTLILTGVPKDAAYAAAFSVTVRVGPTELTSTVVPK